MSLPRIPVRPFATLTDELNAKAVATMWQQKKFLWESDTMPNVSGRSYDASVKKEPGYEVYPCPVCKCGWVLESVRGVLTLEQTASSDTGTLLAESCNCCRTLLHILHQDVRDWHANASKPTPEFMTEWEKALVTSSGEYLKDARGVSAVVCSKCSMPYTHGKPNCSCK